MKTSRLALIAAAGFALSAAISPAKAADLGGGCCADLEERVAELEATTARKGNRVVSLQVYGQVNKALMIWDDGVDSDAFVVDNTYSSSRVGFTGKAKISPGWSAGFLMEFDFNESQASRVNNGATTTGDGSKNGDDTGDLLTIRQNNLYIESERFGRITLGLGSTAADGANEVVLGNSLSSSLNFVGSSFALRYANGQYSSYKMNDFANNLDGVREQVVRYDSPSIYGFILSASWGDNDYADVALRFKKEFNSIRVAAAVAYQWDGTEDGTSGSGSVPSGFDAGSSFNVLSGSVSVMHVPTGIYGAFAAGQKEWDDNVRSGSDEADFWYAQGGIEKKFLPYGSTTVYGEYGQYNDMAFAGSEATRWGLGIVQKIDSAAMDIYAQGTFWSFDGVVNGLGQTPEDLTTVMVGSRIKF